MAIPRVLARAVALAALAPPTLLGCASLEPYPVGTCGNAVVENDGVSTFEQCDTHVEAGQRCGDPGTPEACRHVCAAADPADPSSAASCPAGSTCGVDGVCRRGSGVFALGSVEANFSFGSRLADFDGSGVADVMTAGLSRVDISYLDPRGAVASRQEFGSGILLLPEVGHLDAAPATGPDPADAVFTVDGDVVVALGGPAGLTPKSYAGIRLAARPPIHFFPVPGAAERGLDVSAAMAIVGGDPPRLVELDGQRTTTVVESWPIDAAPPFHVATADLDPSSPRCHEVVMSYGSFLATWRPCGPGDVRIVEEPRIVRLVGGPDGAVPVQARGAHLVDLDADGARDVLVEVNECWKEQPDACAIDVRGRRADEPTCCRVYAGLGVLDADGAPTGRFQAISADGDELDAVSPWFDLEFEDPAGERAVEHLLGVGDFDGDPYPDVVLTSSILGGGGAGLARVAAVNPGVPWTDAAIGDVDGDGLDDVVATSSAGPSLDYFRGDRSGTLARAGIQVPRPFFDLLLGDFDGDARLDLVGRTFSADLASEELAVLFFDDRTFGAPRTLGTFPLPSSDPSVDDTGAIQQVAAAPLLTNRDPLHDLAAITTFEADGEQRVAIALYEGRPNRQLVAPIVVTEDGATRDVAAATFGRFDGAGPTIVADAFAIPLDPTTLELVGAPRRLDALGSALSAAFGDLEHFPELVVLAAGDVDGDGLDELVAAVPGCDQVSCGASTLCCTPGSFTTRVFLLDAAGTDFVPAPTAPVAIALPTIVANATIEGTVSLAGSIRVLDLDADGVGEVVAVGYDDDQQPAAERTILTRGSIIALVDGSHREVPLPTTALVDGQEIAVSVRGVAPLRGPAGAPRIALATDAGLFAADLDPHTFAVGVAEPILGDTGQPLAIGEVSNVEAGDVTGDGIVDLVLTRTFATEIFVGLESLEAP